jgi:NAD(P)H-dependent FMN reductase
LFYFTSEFSGLCVTPPDERLHSIVDRQTDSGHDAPARAWSRLRIVDRLRIGVILSSVREGRRGEAFAHWIHGLLSPRPEVDAELVDLRDWPLGPYARRESSTIAEKSYATGSLEKRWAEKVGALDAFVIVTPEYSHGYPGQLKNALDHVYAGWNYKPVAFLSYGGMAAGARAVEQLRAVAIELRMAPIRDEVNVRLIGFAADEKGAPGDELYQKRGAAMLDELVWWARVLRSGRAAHPR